MRLTQCYLAGKELFACLVIHSIAGQLLLVMQFSTITQCILNTFEHRLASSVWAVHVAWTPVGGIQFHKQGV